MEYYNTLVLFLGAVGLECRVDQPFRVEIQHGMAVPGELKTKMSETIHLVTNTGFRLTALVLRNSNLVSPQMLLDYHRCY